MCVAYPFIGGIVNTMTTKPERNEDRRNPDQGSGITRIRATESECEPNGESEVNHD